MRRPTQAEKYLQEETLALCSNRIVESTAGPRVRKHSLRWHALSYKDTFAPLIFHLFLMQPLYARVSVVILSQLSVRIL